MKRYIIAILCCYLAFTCNFAIAQNEVSFNVDANQARIENSYISIEFNLSNGSYSGIDKSDNTKVFKDAWYRVGRSGWAEPKCIYKTEQFENVESYQIAVAEIF